MNAIILLIGSTLSLEDALHQLDQQSPALAQARSKAAEVSALARQALSPALPQASVSGSYTRNSQAAVAPIGLLAAGVLPPGAPLPPNLVIQPLEVWNVTGSARVPLINTSAWAEFAAALRAAEAADASAEQVRQQLRFALKQLAYLSRAANEIVSASERAVANAIAHVKSARVAKEAGTGTSLGVLQAETERVRRESDLAQARVEDLRLQLAVGVLLGKDEMVRITLPEKVESIGGLRADVHAAELQVQAAGRQVNAAWLRHVPQLSISGAAFKQNVPLPTGRDDGWRFTLDLTWTIDDGGFRYGKLRQAEAQRAGALAAQEALRLQVAQEVADGKRNVELAAEKLRLAEEQQKFAHEAANSARREFEAGIVSSLELRDANDRLFQAEVILANGRARVGTADAALALALGEAIRTLGALSKLATLSFDELLTCKRDSFTRRDT